MATTYHIEKAKSARSKCKKCKETIVKDDMRIGSSSERDDRIMTSWNHIKCFSLPRALKQQGITIESFVLDELKDPDGLLDEHSDEIIAELESKGSAKKTPKKVVDSSTMLGKIKRNYAESMDDEEDRPAKKTKLSKTEKEEVELYEIYKNKNADELKDYMRWNHQIIGGRKDALILRCIDGQMRGRLARCPMCKQGKPKIAEEDHDYASCNGYFDEDMQSRVPCNFQISLDKAARLHPWYTEPPTEEQEEEMKAQDEVAKSGKAPPNPKNESAAKEILRKAETMEWKVKSKEDIKSTTEAIVKICLDGGVSLPKGSEQKAVGKLVVQCKTATAAEVIKLIIDEYGFASGKDTGDQAIDNVAASLCKVPANAKLYAMLDEFAELMRKSGEFMKSNMQKKCAQAIAALPFEVTEENALKLGKPGKAKIPGIGKSSAEKMHEYLTTGKVAKLEELRASIE
ncbi:NAD+ ADP-ribosyltransferase [Fragilaria crotonensis]|nr:NAD+ ADP-ribosyltransferase [Fragilaria crotonensis]